MSLHSLDRCKVQPISNQIKEQRWKLFGHILRRGDTITAYTAMHEYFDEGPKYLGRPPTSLPTILNQDLRHCRKVFGEAHLSKNEHITSLPAGLESRNDLAALKNLAQDRDTWKQVTEYIQRNDQDHHTSMMHSPGQAS